MRITIQFQNIKKTSDKQKNSQLQQNERKENF